MYVWFWLAHPIRWTKPIQIQGSFRVNNYCIVEPDILQGVHCFFAKYSVLIGRLVVVAMRAWSPSKRIAVMVAALTNHKIQRIREEKTAYFQRDLTFWREGRVVGW